MSRTAKRPSVRVAPTGTSVAATSTATLGPPETSASRRLKYNWPSPRLTTPAAAETMRPSFFIGFRPRFEGQNLVGQRPPTVTQNLQATSLELGDRRDGAPVLGRRAGDEDVSPQALGAQRRRSAAWSHVPAAG